MKLASGSTYSHTNSTDNQDRLATKLVDIHDGRNRCAEPWLVVRTERWGGRSLQEHDNTDHTGSEQRDGVSRQAETFEDLRGVVEDGIDTGPIQRLAHLRHKIWTCGRIQSSPLLEKHGQTGHDDTLEHRLRLEKRTDGDELQLDSGPSRVISKVREMFGDRALLEERLGPDLCELKLNELVVLGQTAKLGQGTFRIRLSVVMDKPTTRISKKKTPSKALPENSPRAEGHEHHSDTENNSRRQLQAQRNEPGRVLLSTACAADVVGSVVNPEGNHDAKRDGQLLQTHQGSSDL